MGIPTIIVPAAAQQLVSTSTYRFIDLLCEGPIEGIVTDGVFNTEGHQSILIDDTGLQNKDSEQYNFEGITVSQRQGTPDQNPIGGFFDLISNPTDVGNTEVVKYTLPDNTGDLSLGVSRSISAVDGLYADAVYVLIYIPGLYEVDDEGSKVPRDLEFTITIEATDTGLLSIFPKMVSGIASSAYQVNYRLNLPASSDGAYTITITRDTDDVTEEQSDHYTAGLYWSSYIVVTDRKLIYPDSAIVAMSIESELFGNSVPKRGYLTRGLKVKVPVGYTPPYKNSSGVWQAGVYPGLWGGLLSADGDVVYTSNPAWCLYDLLTNTRYGAGIPDNDDILKTALYPISQYCDALIDDGSGMGTTEPRFTLNTLIKDQSEAYTLINNLISVFRGMGWWGTGAVAVSQDSPTDPRILVNPSNVIDGLFTYEGSALKARHSTVLVSWTDPSNHSEPTVEVVEDQDLILQYGYRPIDILAFGCNSRGQAIRVGKWILDSEKNETEIVKYSAGLDHAFVTPGMIVSVVDPYYTSPTDASATENRDASELHRWGGRVVSATSTTITIDAPVTLETGTQYLLSVVTNMADSESGLPILEDISIDEVSTGYDTEVTEITLSSSFTSIPESGAVWMIIPTNVTPRTFRIMSVTETEDGAFDVVALQHDPTKYARVESGINVEATPWIDYEPDGVVTPPTSPSLIFGSVFSDGALQETLVFSWVNSTDPRVTEYQVEYRRSGTATTDIGNWEKFAPTTTSQVELLTVVTGYYEFRVKALTVSDGDSLWVTDTLDVDSNILPAVTGLVVVNQGTDEFDYIGDAVEVTWDQTSNANIANSALNVTDSNFSTYVVTIDSSFVYETIDNKFTYLKSYNDSDHSGTGIRSFDVVVQQKSTSGAYSDPTTITVDNPAPDMSTHTPTVAGSFRGLSIDWTAWSSVDPDIESVKIYADESNPPTTLIDTVQHENDRYLLSDLEYGVTYYVQLVPVDSFGDGTPSSVSSGTPIVLEGVDVVTELSGSILITDDDGSSQAELDALYDRITTSGGPTYTLIGSEITIQYAFGVEDYIDKVIVYASSTPGQVYIKYSIDGITWSYLQAEADHTLTDVGDELLAGTAGTAPANYWQLESGLNVAVFPQRIVAKYCQLVMVGNYTTTIYELTFVREVIAEQVVADNLSALSAQLGTVYSDDYVAGTTGFIIDGEGGTAEFNDIVVSFNSPSDVRDDLNVDDGATANQSDSTTNSAISSAAGTSTWNGVSGTGKPANNADQTSTVNLALQINNNTTTINGGKITTGTILTEHLESGIINVGTLIADNIITTGHVQTDAITVVIAKVAAGYEVNNANAYMVLPAHATYTCIGSIHTSFWGGWIYMNYAIAPHPGYGVPAASGWVPAQSAIISVEATGVMIFKYTNPYNFPMLIASQMIGSNVNQINASFISTIYKR